MCRSRVKSYMRTPNHECQHGPVDGIGTGVKEVLAFALRSKISADCSHQDVDLLQL